MSAGRILVVDDEPQIVRGLRVVLRGAGYDVESAETKAEALDVAAVRPPDAMVLDRGRGVPPSQRQRIFEPFFRGSDPGQGSGLGLAICRGFVEANGGTIQYRRTGSETAFAVAFPLVRQPAAA